MPKTSRTRRRPLPATTRTGGPLSPPESQDVSNTVTGTSVSTATSSLPTTYAPSARNRPNGEGDQLLQQAGALATMSLEVNLHAVSTIAYKLQDEVKKLVLCTSEDQNYRRQNEERMTQMMHEVQTVKAFMAPLKGRPPATWACIEKLQEEMRQNSLQWHKQLGAIEAQLDALSTRKEQPSTLVPTKTTDNAPITPDTSSRETRTMEKTKDEMKPSNKKQQNSSSSSNPDSRVRDAINSTKRWNREHKITKLEDNQFINSYFLKQAQRDAKLAGILHRAFQIRVAKRVKAKPNSLSREELSRLALWKDVIETATEVLVINKMKTAHLMGQS